MDFCWSAANRAAATDSICWRTAGNFSNIMLKSAAGILTTSTASSAVQVAVRLI
jgi:urease accessory protein UreF